MDICIQANKESVILTSLEKSLQTDLSYKITKNYPNISKSLLEIQPNIPVSGNPAGKEVIFNLPRYGLLSNLLIKSTVQSATTQTGLATSDVPFGMMLFETIELRSHNRVICSNSDAYLRIRLDNDKPSRAIGDLYRAKVGAAFAASTDYTVYTPFRCSFFEDVRNYLDLNFVEQLQLRCVFNTSARMGLNTSLSSATVSCWMSYYNMESSALSVLRGRNFKPEKPLVMLAYDTYCETGTLVDDATTTTINLNVNNAVFATHFFLRNNALNGSGAFVAITNFSVKLGGKTIYDTVPHKVATAETDRECGFAGMFSDASILTNSDTLRPISIWWGLEPGERRYNSGAVSFHNINNPQLIITHADPGTITDYYVVHEYWSLVSVNSADGKVEVSASI